MRDHVTPGVVERLMVEHVETTIGPYKKDSYSNRDLAKYAVKIGERLMKRDTKPSVKRQEAARKAGRERLSRRGRASSGTASIEETIRRPELPEQQ
jgi:hypothetical protein